MAILRCGRAGDTHERAGELAPSWHAGTTHLSDAHEPLDQDARDHELAVTNPRDHDSRTMITAFGYGGRDHKGMITGI
jgi:hypothetical protein